MPPKLAPGSYSSSLLDCIDFDLLRAVSMLVCLIEEELVADSTHQKFPNHLSQGIWEGEQINRELAS